MKLPLQEPKMKNGAHLFFLDDNPSGGFFRPRARKYRFIVKASSEATALKRLLQQARLALPQVRMTVGNRRIKDDLVSVDLIAQGFDPDLNALFVFIKNVIAEKVAEFKKGTEARWRAQSKHFIDLKAAVSFLSDPQPSHRMPTAS
jgi:hypothetical protein